MLLASKARANTYANQYLLGEPPCKGDYSYQFFLQRKIPPKKHKKQLQMNSKITVSRRPTGTKVQEAQRKEN